MGKRRGPEEETTTHLVYKVVRRQGRRYFSIVTGPLAVEYGVGHVTYPTQGLLFAFLTAAHAWAYYATNWGEATEPTPFEVWEARTMGEFEQLPAYLPNPNTLPNMPIAAVKQFWAAPLFAENSIATPAGSVGCTDIQLMRRLPRMPLT